jgi:hypothetical protein
VPRGVLLDRAIARQHSQPFARLRSAGACGFREHEHGGAGMIAQRFKQFALGFR